VKAVVYDDGAIASCAISVLVNPQRHIHTLLKLFERRVGLVRVSESHLLHFQRRFRGEQVHERVAKVFSGPSRGRHVRLKRRRRVFLDFVDVVWRTLEQRFHRHHP